MESQFQAKLTLILRISLNAILKTIYKSLKSAKIFVKKWFELQPGDVNSIKLGFVLYPLMIYYFLKEHGYKKYLLCLYVSD